MNVKNSFPNIAAELINNYIQKTLEFAEDEKNKYKLYKKESLNICGFRLTIEDEGMSTHELCISQDEAVKLQLNKTRQIWVHLENKNDSVISFYLATNIEKTEIEKLIIQQLDEQIKNFAGKISMINSLLSDKFLASN
jgi:regulator of sigma D